MLPPLVLLVACSCTAQSLTAPSGTPHPQVRASCTAQILQLHCIWQRGGYLHLNCC